MGFAKPRRFGDVRPGGQFAYCRRQIVGGWDQPPQNMTRIGRYGASEERCPLCARNSRSMGASLIFTGRTLFRSDRRLAVIRISLKDEAIKASILSLPDIGGA
jgi:hypothetical protein